MPGLPGDPKSDQYLQQKKIPQLFQSFTMALLYNQPTDHIDYLLQRLDEVKAMGADSVKWDSFLPPGTPLPPPQIYAAATQSQPPTTSKMPKVSEFHGSMIPGAKR